MQNAKIKEINQATVELCELATRSPERVVIAMRAGMSQIYDLAASGPGDDEAVVRKVLRDLLDLLR